MPILSGESSWLPVMNVHMRKHVKFNNPDAPPTLCVEYLSGLSVYSDYVAFEHRGQARTFAERFWFAFGGEAPVPITVDEALIRKDELGCPYEISVARNGRFWNVTERRLAPRRRLACRDRSLLSDLDNPFARGSDGRARQQPINDECIFEQRRSLALRPKSRRCARCAAGMRCGSATRRDRTAGRSSGCATTTAATWRQKGLFKMPANILDAYEIGIGARSRQARWRLSRRDQQD